MANKIKTIDDLKKALGLNSQEEVDAYLEEFYTRAKAVYESTNSFDLAAMEDELDNMLQSKNLDVLEKEEIERIHEIMFDELKRRYGFQ